MKSFKIILLLLLFNCNNNKNTEIDFCKISNFLYLEKKKENPQQHDFLVYDKVEKINDLSIKKYLLTSLDNLKEYDIADYFSNSHTQINYDINCKIVESKKIISNVSREIFWKEYSLYYGNKDFIKFYEPIFNKDKTKFILLYEYFKFELGSSFSLVICEKINNQIIIKDVLLASSY